jgi:AraC family transcriptional regulator
MRPSSVRASRAKPPMERIETAPRLPRASADLFERQGVEVRRHLHSVGLEVRDLAASEPFAAPRHYHEVAHFVFLMRGDLAWTTSTRRQECLPWRGVFHPAGIEHQTFGGAGLRAFSMEVGPAWIERLNEHAPPPDHPVTLDEESRAVATRLLAELRGFRPCSLLVIEGLTAELLAGAARMLPGSERRVPLWMNGLLEQLRAEFDRPQRLHDLALAMNLHPGRLSRSFRRATGKTIGGYVRDLRVQYLLRQLSASDAPICELAAAAGFFDQSHCTREFKRATGLTPADYRNTVRGRRRGRVGVPEAGGPRA